MWATVHGRTDAQVIIWDTIARDSPSLYINYTSQQPLLKVLLPYFLRWGNPQASFAVTEQKSPTLHVQTGLGTHMTKFTVKYIVAHCKAGANVQKSTLQLWDMLCLGEKQLWSCWQIWDTSLSLKLFLMQCIKMSLGLISGKWFLCHISFVTLVYHSWDKSVKQVA